MDAVEMLEKWQRICRKEGSCGCCRLYKNCPICQDDFFTVSDYGEDLDFRSFVNSIKKEVNDDL